LVKNISDSLPALFCCDFLCSFLTEEVTMSFELLNTILKMQIGKTGKLVLAVMASNDLKRKWLVKELVEYIGGDAKTVRFAIRELTEKQLVNHVDKTLNQANIYTINPSHIMLFAQNHSDDMLIENELTRLERQVQRYHQKHSNLSKQTRKS